MQREGGVLNSEERRAERARKTEARRKKAQELGVRLRILRAVRGYTQARLSELTGLSRQYLSDVERGKRPRPGGETLQGLAAALGVTVEELRGATTLRDVVDPLPGEAAPSSSEGAAPPDPPGGAPAGVEAPAAPPGAHGAFALTGVVPEALQTIGAVAQALETMPSGVVVLHREYPDGSVLLYIRLPAGSVKPPG